MCRLLLLTLCIMKFAIEPVKPANVPNSVIVESDNPIINADDEPKLEDSVDTDIFNSDFDIAITDGNFIEAEREMEQLKLDTIKHDYSERIETHYAKLDKLNSLGSDLQFNFDWDVWEDERDFSYQERELIEGLKKSKLVGPEQLDQLVDDLVRAKAKNRPILDYDIDDEGWQEGDPGYVMDKMGSQIDDEQTSLSPIAFDAVTKKSEPFRMANQQTISQGLQRLETIMLCQKPLERCVKVHEVYRDSTKVYIPPCVRLHTCADDTGCCTFGAFCGPKNGTQQIVTMPFYTSSASGKNMDEDLSFFNHTECECMVKKRREPSPTPATLYAVPALAVYPSSSSAATRPPSSPPPVDDVDLEPATAAPHADIVQMTPSLPLCRCPKYFTPGLVGTGCECDCSTRNESQRQACQALKQGREHFSLEARSCILKKTCTEPVCQFGRYNSTLGSCPGKAVYSRAPRNYRMARRSQRRLRFRGY